MANREDNLIHITSETASELGRKGGHAKKGVKHLSTWIQELLNDEEFTAQIQEGYKIVEYKGAPIKAIVRAQMVRALNGDAKAFDLLGKYGFGAITKVEEKSDQTVTIVTRKHGQSDD